MPAGFARGKAALVQPAATTRNYLMDLSPLGASPKRREDARFVTGRGTYLDDLRFEGLAHATVLRAPHAHALIRSI
jgi:xanthine dehydrogenase molybdopterin-binding subunit B